MNATDSPQYQLYSMQSRQNDAKLTCRCLGNGPRANPRLTIGDQWTVPSSRWSHARWAGQSSTHGAYPILWRQTSRERERAGWRGVERILKTARGRERQFRCLRLMRPLGLDRSAFGLATSVSTQLWAWHSNLCIEPLQKLLYQIWAKVKKICKFMQIR